MISLRSLAAAFLLLLPLASPRAATVLPPLPLWPNGAPEAHGTADTDVPTVTAYLPDAGKATGAAFVIFPGGGYLHLADHEGKGYAEWLADHGVAGIVVKYRLAPYHYPAQFDDGTRAVRLVRAKAAEWKIDPHRVGVIGSSAGGHLASMVLTHFDAGKPDAADPVERESSRPDLGVLCYAVIAMTGPNTHEGSKANLLGPTPDPALAETLSSEKQVTAETPPCFIWHTWEDATVKVENALDFAAALKAHGVRFELHIYEKGAHGIGLRTGHRWGNDCLAWLDEQRWLAPHTP